MGICLIFMSPTPHIWTRRGDRTKVGHLALGGSLACCFYQCPIESRGFTSVITGLPNGTIHEKEYIREGVTICPITNNVRRKADGTNPRS